jgi:hypothetical protein
LVGPEGKSEDKFKFFFETFSDAAQRKTYNSKTLKIGFKKFFSQPTFDTTNFLLNANPMKDIPSGRLAYR